MATRFHVAAFAVALSACSLLVSADEPEKKDKKTPQERYDAAVEKFKEANIKAIMETIEGNKKEIQEFIKAKDQAGAAGARSKLATNSAYLEKLKAGKIRVPLELQSPLNVGQVGSPYKVRVIQVVNDREMIVELGVSDSIGKTVQYTAWLEGISTSGRVDGEQIKLDSPIEIIGTKKYETVVGAAKTVFHAEYLPIKPR